MKLIDWAFLQSDISYAEKLILVYLAYIAEDSKCFIMNKMLSEDLGFCRRQVIRALQSLELKKKVKSAKIRNPHGLDKGKEYIVCPNREDLNMFAGLLKAKRELRKYNSLTLKTENKLREELCAILK